MSLKETKLVRSPNADPASHKTISQFYRKEYTRRISKTWNARVAWAWKRCQSEHKNSNFVSHSSDWLTHLTTSRQSPSVAKRKYSSPGRSLHSSSRFISESSSSSCLLFRAAVAVEKWKEIVHSQFLSLFICCWYFYIRPFPSSAVICYTIHESSTQLVYAFRRLSPPLQSFVSCWEWINVLINASLLFRDFNRFSLSALCMPPLSFALWIKTFFSYIPILSSLCCFSFNHFWTMNF